MGVVEQHDERAVLGPPGEHRERRGPDREGRWRVAVTQGEGHAQRPALGNGQLVELVGDVAEHEAERGVRHLLLGLGAHHAHHRGTGRQRGHLVEQGRLADPGLPRDDEGSPTAQAGAGEQLGHPPQLGLAPHDHG